MNLIVDHARSAVLIGLIALTALLPASHNVQPEGRPIPATQAQVAASLARGTAWIWPTSNGPIWQEGGEPVYQQAAVLVEALRLTEGGVEYGGRRTSLAAPPIARLIPVIHVESSTRSPNDLKPAQREAVVRALLRQVAAADGGAGVVQLDFEAPPRQRSSYRQLIAEARAALPDRIRLSVTALAHWCAEGDWLDRLEADEVVPMLYRLGPQASLWRHRIARGDPALARRCRGPAMGFATDEPPPAALLRRIERAYWFDNDAWSNPSRPTVYLEVPR